MTENKEWGVIYTNLKSHHDPDKFRIRDADGKAYEFKFAPNETTYVPENLARKFAAIDCDGRKSGPFVVTTPDGTVYVPRLIKQKDGAGKSITLGPGQVIAELAELSTEALKVRCLALGIDAKDVPTKRDDRIKVIMDGGLFIDEEDGDLIEDDDNPDDLD